MKNISRSISFSFTSSLVSAGHAGRTAALLSIICLICIPFVALAQVQLGADIDGEAAYDYVRGVSLSADGGRLAVGAGQNDGVNGVDSGHVRVFEWSGSQWTQLGADIDGEGENDWFGDAVSMSADGNRVAVGAKSNSGGAEYAGHVRVYQWTGSAWTQMGSDIDGEAAYDNFGLSVSISADGNRVAATSSESSSGGESFGHVRVFEWSGANWTQLGANINGKAMYDRIQSVSLSADGDRVALGAWGVAGNTGQARVYEWSGEAWSQLGADIDAEAAADSFGASVSLSGDGTRLAVGGPANDGNGAWAGHTRVFEWSAGNWSQLGADIDGDTGENWSGSSVSLSSLGNRLAIGAVSKTGNGDYTGVVRVYQWSGSGWTKIGSDIDGEAANDAFGYMVALSSNGNRLAASADQNDGNGPQSGHARVFDLSTFNVFQINPGLNDHWYNPQTVGQGLYVTVFPVLGKVTMTMFSYDTVLPPVEATANLGDPSQRWLNALGRYSGNQATMSISFDYDGLFDSPTVTTKVRSYGTFTLTFDSCNSGTLAYDIPALSLNGMIPIERIVADNVPLCEAFLAEYTGN